MSSLPDQIAKPGNDYSQINLLCFYFGLPFQKSAEKMAKKINRGKRGIEPRASSNFMFKSLNPNEESYH